ncbi:C-x8-C-x5-C-x3-H zinc finger protein [Aspergillus eucalypticola CBS 122712]|uniref:C-x8-C-x5-C-x3-H zinc finger protein n=1 Tax=Aspergillus eucalypticola (strain CBS 122712 / IBT 29274) TaxID=1448314 RepID=A0A317W4J3_ASPEC|nr:C-x8-C-x5-C-x3-H zinc finger protein [Aspergillus eucalypticola CBS 122712]PWY79100.1 C-x8-C-x5-C-x3-H zinc finger protein [Aspergillus eucalypticola CBS 122712]
MTAPEYFERYKQLASIEQDKNILIEELLQRVTELEAAFQQEKLDHERETRFNRDIQLHEMELMQHIARIKAIMDREPFIVVLLDGTGIIFKDEFLQKGEEGGKVAANKLAVALKDYVASNFPGLDNPKIITRMYVNLKGLSEMCVRGVISTDPSSIEGFAKGFNNGHPLFDLVDTGLDNAHDKIAEAFKVNLYNCHCHQIFLGCADTNAYAQILVDIMEDIDLVGRVTLIEGITFEKDLAKIKAAYRVSQFPEILRNTKITPVWAPWKAAVASKPPPALTPSPKPGAVPLSRTSTSTSTNASTSMSSTSARPSTPGDFQVVQSKSVTPARPKIVERNKYGQRVDRVDFKSIPREEMNRLKKLKLCNLHYLLGECTIDNCQHDHSRKLTRSELSVLTAIARMTPCRYGLDCDDPECTYGHRCPHAEPGKKDCYWGSSCRFDPTAHGIDTNIVRLTKV